MKRLTLLAVLVAAVVTVPSASPSAAGRYTPVALTMVREAVPAAEAYFFDHGSYAGMTLARLRRIDGGLSSIEVARARKGSYCLQADVLGSWAHYAGPGGKVRAGRCR